VPSNRALKVADRIREIVAASLEGRVKDPRLGFVTITDVRVTGDLQNASVFYTVFGDHDQQAKTKAALESAKGLLRTAVGHELGTRITPTLEFFSDALPEAAQQMESLLSEIKKHDDEVAKIAKGAKPVVEDPYKK